MGITCSVLGLVKHCNGVGHMSPVYHDHHHIHIIMSISIVGICCWLCIHDRVDAHRGTTIFVYELSRHFQRQPCNITHPMTIFEPQPLPS